MKFYTLPLGMLQTNCYILTDEKGTAAVIDPGDKPMEVLKFVGNLHARVGAILLTHGHFDHVGAVRGIQEAVRCPVWIHEREEELPETMSDGPLFYTDTFAHGDVIRVGEMEFQALHTPGHSPGSSCFRVENLLLSGDTLFAGSCGRTDFPGGNYEEILRSLRSLREIPENLVVLPGHGPSSTLDQERASNPYMK